MRSGDWRVAPLPADLLDRRVEITGPTDRKMVINALNSGASVYMPDFEDSNCPTWDNLVQGQVRRRPRTWARACVCLPEAAPGEPARTHGAVPREPAAAALETPSYKIPWPTAAALQLDPYRAVALALTLTPTPCPCRLRPLQINLRDAVRGTITLSSAGKTYRLNPRVATMIVRPRG